MENSNFETLNFPPYRRRPLRSQTFQSLLQFVSILDDDAQSSKSSNSDSGGPESGAVNAKVVNDPLANENRGVSGILEGNLDNTHGEIIGSDQILKNKELAHVDDTNFMNLLGNDNQDSSLLMSNLEEQSIVPKVLRVEELTPPMEVDPKLPTHEKCYDVTPSLDEDKMVTLSPCVNNNKKYVPVDMIISLEEGSDHRQCTWMALDKPTIASGAMQSPLTADGEAEEGEISGKSLGLSPEDVILSKEKMGNEEHFSGDVSGKVQHIGLDKGEKSNPWPEGVIGNLGKRMESESREPKRNLVEYNSEIFTHGRNVKHSKLNGYRCKPKTGGTNTQKSGAKESDPAGVGLKKSVQFGGALVDDVSKYLHSTSAKKDADVASERKRQAPQAKEKRANEKIRTSLDKFDSVVPGKLIEPLNTEGYVINLKSVRKESQGSGVKNSGDPEVCPENLPSVGVLSAETVSQNKENASPEKGDDVPEKKRKRVLTKERKAKKKQKAKMKLAEKNGRPAVKRMQLQPVAKPKSVCRHYMHGRCKEGAQCKFSHDTIPLTKSTPCSHFARHSCMKGDQCPFDHDLSKYTCNNFQTKGSCSRGADCLFSHKMQASEGAASSTVKAAGPDLTLSVLDIAKSSALASKGTVTTPKSSVLAPNGATMATPIGTMATPKSSALAPKGATMATPIGTMTTPKSNPLASKGATTATPIGTAASPKSSALAPKMATMATALGTVATPKLGGAPKGMSFLSFLPETGSTPKADTVKVDHQLTSNSIPVPNNNEITKKISAVAPRGINFLAFAKKPLTDVPNPSSSLKRNDGIGKSPLSNFCEGEKSNPSLKNDDKVNVNNLVNKSQPDGSRSKTQVDFEKMILPKTPMSIQNMLKSTLTFPAKFESGVKIGSPVIRSDLNKEAGSSSNSFTKASSVLDFILGSSSKTL